jgi:hypothetical protein
MGRRPRAAGPPVLRRRHSGRLSHRPGWRCQFWSWYGDAFGVRDAVWRSAGAIMGNVVYDFLLFSCMALFVTGIVLAAASLLI